MNNNPNGLWNLIMGNWASSKTVYWVWKWFTLMVVLLPWSFISSMIWDRGSMWDSYADLAGLATFAVIISALFFGKQFLPKHLQ